MKRKGNHLAAPLALFSQVKRHSELVWLKTHDHDVPDQNRRRRFDTARLLQHLLHHCFFLNTSFFIGNVILTKELLSFFAGSSARC